MFVPDVGAQQFHYLLRAGYAPYAWPHVQGSIFLPHIKRPESPSPEVLDRSYTNEKLRIGKLYHNLVIISQRHV